MTNPERRRIQTPVTTTRFNFHRSPRGDRQLGENAQQQPAEHPGAPDTYHAGAISVIVPWRPEVQVGHAPLSSNNWGGGGSVYNTAVRRKRFFDFRDF